MQNPFNSEAENELEQRTEALRRVTADFVNYRRRVAGERARDKDHAVVELLAALVPILDDLDRAETHGELTGGFEAVSRRLRAELTSVGLERYGEPGEVFDPRIHNALAQLPTDDVDEPVILDVASPGYAYRGLEVRPAQVAVAVPAT